MQPQCARCDASAHPWREAADTYGLTLQEAVAWNTDGNRNNNNNVASTHNADARWVRNAVAADVVGCTCGAVGSASTWAPLHCAKEAALCRAIADECVAALAGVDVRRGDESDHPWCAFVAPATPGAPWTALDVHTLREAMGGSLCPQLEFKTAPLGDYLAEYRASVARDGEDDGGAGNRAMSGYFAALAVLQRHGCTQLSGWRPLEMGGRERSLALTCVYPHFMLGLTPGGSVVGVFGLTVWT